MQKKALLLSAYDAESHHHWRQILTNSITEYEWTQISLPARHFFWRVRSNGLSFALEHREELSADYDVLIATSMVDLATLRGLVPELATVPALVYFHENQFEYPIRESASERRIVNAQLSSISTALCANRVLFNSEYNRCSFLSGVSEFVKRMPDGLSPTIVGDIENISAVLPVPIQSDAGSNSAHNHTDTNSDINEKASCVDIVWAHRWEFDKQPEVFFNALEKLYAMSEFASLGIHLRLHVMGQSFRKVPDCFEYANDLGIHSIKTWGYQDRKEYNRILSNSQFAISTALHDFQGLGMIEAIHRGCVPVAPNRVAYPEYIPDALLYNTGTPEQESTALALKLCHLLSTGQHQDKDKAPTDPDVSGYLEEQLIPLYKDEISAL